MLRRLFTVVIAVVAGAGCPGGNGRVGDACGGHDDCAGALQCLNRSCVARCRYAPDCGDGYSCESNGLCKLATLEQGASCPSETACTAGLTCQLSGAVDGGGKLVAKCNFEGPGHPAGYECKDDQDCNAGACALGHCVNLCRVDSLDCAEDDRCMSIPHPTLPNAMFSACLPADGALSWSIPMNSPKEEILLPFPDGARSAQLVMIVDDPNQKVGAVSVLSPGNGERLYRMPCSTSGSPPCDPVASTNDFFTNQIRHRPGFGQSVLLIPSAEAPSPKPGMYRVEVSSFRANDQPGSAIPQVTAVVQLSPERSMRGDLHFFFLDLTDHPCSEKMDNGTLNATTAISSPNFKAYLAELRTIFFRASMGSLIFENFTYDDVRAPDDDVRAPDLDSLDVADAGNLLRLGKYGTGINVFFVRSLSPVGTQAFAPNPGPARLAGTRQSGIVIGLDTLCYRDWDVLARITAHEIARYMGLYHNVELEVQQHPTWRDQIHDNDFDDPRNNLMFFSEFGRTVLTREQIRMLMRSAVLQ
jgi:hypothetical protein